MEVQGHRVHDDVLMMLLSVTNEIFNLIMPIFAAEKCINLKAQF